MRQKSGTTSSPSERLVKNIRRATRKQYSAEEKIRIVLDGLRGESSIAELCRREGIAEGLYYSWSKEFLEAGKRPSLRRMSWARGFRQRLFARIVEIGVGDRNRHSAKEVEMAAGRTGSDGEKDASLGSALEIRSIHISGHDRQSHDFYPTPDWVTQALLKHVTLRGRVWEPCCGDGAMARVLERAGHKVVATDLVDRGFGRGGVDFFECSSFPAGCRTMVTNPPYGDGGQLGRPPAGPLGLQTFIRHALDLTERANGQLALLVRFQWMAGKRAATLISSGPLSRVVVLTKRIQWFDMGERTKTGQHHHAWLFWDCSHGRLLPPSLIFSD